MRITSWIILHCFELTKLVSTGDSGEIFSPEPAAIQCDVWSSNSDIIVMRTISLGASELKSKELMSRCYHGASEVIDLETSTFRFHGIIATAKSIPKDSEWTVPCWAVLPSQSLAPSKQSMNASWRSGATLLIKAAIYTKTGRILPTLEGNQERHWTSRKDGTMFKPVTTGILLNSSKI